MNNLFIFPLLLFDLPIFLVNHLEQRFIFGLIFLQLVGYLGSSVDMDIFNKFHVLIMQEGILSFQLLYLVFVIQFSLEEEGFSLLSFFIIHPYFLLLVGIHSFVILSNFHHFITMPSTHILHDLLKLLNLQMSFIFLQQNGIKFFFVFIKHLSNSLLFPCE